MHPQHILRRVRRVRPEHRRWQLSDSGMDRCNLASWMGKLAMHREAAVNDPRAMRWEDRWVSIERTLEKIRQARQDAMAWGWRLPQ